MFQAPLGRGHDEAVAGAGRVDLARLVAGVAGPDRDEPALGPADRRLVDLGLARRGRRPSGRRRSRTAPGSAASSTWAVRAPPRRRRGARSRRPAPSTRESWISPPSIVDRALGRGADEEPRREPPRRARRRRPVRDPRELARLDAQVGFLDRFAHRGAPGRVLGARGALAVLVVDAARRGTPTSRRRRASSSCAASASRARCRRRGRARPSPPARSCRRARCRGTTLRGGSSWRRLAHLGAPRRGRSRRSPPCSSPRPRVGEHGRAVADRVDERAHLVPVRGLAADAQMLVRVPRCVTCTGCGDPGGSTARRRCSGSRTRSSRCAASP